MVACATTIRFSIVSIDVRFVADYQVVDAFGYSELTPNLHVVVTIGRTTTIGDAEPSASSRRSLRTGKRSACLGLIRPGGGQDACVRTAILT